MPLHPVLYAVSLHGSVGPLHPVLEEGYTVTLSIKRRLLAGEAGARKTLFRNGLLHRNDVLFPSLECRCSDEHGWVANTRWVRRTDVSGGSLAYLHDYLLTCLLFHCFYCSPPLPLNPCGSLSRTQPAH